MSCRRGCFKGLAQPLAIVVRKVRPNKPYIQHHQCNQRSYCNNVAGTT